MPSATMLRIGIFGAMVLSRANAYLLPDDNAGHFIFADTRIADPRYARSAEDLVCVQQDNISPVIRGEPTGQRDHSGGAKSPGHKQIPIGCCPEGDPYGKPYTAGKRCCCGQVYDEDKQFCCDISCSVYSNTLQGITKCNIDSAQPDTTVGPENYEPNQDPTKFVPETSPTPYAKTQPPMPEDPYPTLIEEEGKCARAFYVPNPMEAHCTDENNEGSFCSFSCPGNLKVRIPDNPNRICKDSVWQGDRPECCERDGCPADLRVDFFFILDSSSSIKDKNFQYVREYVIGLLAGMPIGLDKTRVGILTFNNDVIHRVRLNQFDKKSALMEAVNNIPYEGRGTKTNAAIEYAVDVALTEEMGDRPDVPNFVLVLTDGRSTDDVRIASPRLREKAAVIAVGVGKRIESKELEHIAGDPGNVFMVADFRSLPGSLSEGSPVCANAQIETQKEIEEAEANGYGTVVALEDAIGEQARIRREGDGTGGELSADQKISNAQLELQILTNQYNKGDLDEGTYYSELRRLNMKIKALNAERISSGKGKAKGNKGNKGKKGVEALCPNIKDTINAPTVRFTTSFICPKHCIWEEDAFSIFYADNLLSQE